MAIADLRAIVIGAGWAGEGHTRALQHLGVDVVALCARDTAIVQKAARNLGVVRASTDWRQSMLDLKPDIVTLATPAALRSDVVELAARLGCHVLCEKPLATTAEEALRLKTMVTEAHVKHAYAATHRYDPSVAWVTDLLANGVIGRLHEIGVAFAIPYLSERTPWGWLDSLSHGGGALNNAFPHFAGMIETMLRGTIHAVAGEARVLRTKAAYLPGIRDYRVFQSTQLSVDEAAGLEWRVCDADTTYSALLQIDSSIFGTSIAVSMRLNLVAPIPDSTNGWYLYGDKATLFGDGFFELSVERRSESGMEQLPTPKRLLTELPQVGDDVQNKWVALVRDFVGDIRGQPHAPYLTFDDGWRYQAVIDAIRQRKGWYQIPR